MSFAELKETLRESVRQFLWDQWVSIGVAGGARMGRVPFAIDPEALILATTRFGTDDARLFGQAIDWLTSNGGCIVVQRLKSLQAQTLLGEIKVLVALAGRLSQTAGCEHFKALIALRPDPPLPKLEHYLASATLADCGLSQRPDPRLTETFLFKMRSFFGGNARAEIFTWLLTHDSGHPAAISRETGWYSKTVQAVLNEMSESGLVFARSIGREKRFFVDHAAWRFLMPVKGELQWWPQTYFYVGSYYMLQTLSGLAAVEKGSEHLQAIKVRENLTSTLTAFRLAGFDRWFVGGENLAGVDLVDQFREEVRRAIKLLNGRTGFPTASVSGLHPAA